MPVIKFDEFVELVSKLRSAQKNFFKTRQANYLADAKQLEKKVDKAIMEFKNPDTQSKMF